MSYFILVYVMYFDGVGSLYTDQDHPGRGAI